MTEFNGAETIEKDFQKSKLGKLARATKDLKNRVLYGAPQKTYQQDPYLTERLSIALEYKKAMFGYPEIESLVQAGFKDAASYIIFKALTHDPEKHKQFMDDIVDSEVEHPRNTQVLAKVQQFALENLLDPNMEPVDAKKIRQIAGTGISFWSEKFAEIAKDVAAQPQGLHPVYISNAGLMGIRPGIDAYKGTGREMFVLVPDWIKDTEKTICGYTIHTDDEKGNRVKFLQKNFDRPQEFTFIDDTRRTGSHLQDIWSFWSNNSPEPLDNSHVRVIVSVPEGAKI